MLESTRVIDYLGVDKATGYITLALVDDADWSDAAAHIGLLQEKLNTYIASIESGEIYIRLYEATGHRAHPRTPTQIDIFMKYEPSAEGVAFLKYASETFNAVGVRVSRRELNVDLP